mmetsp:Transcript_18201/g.31006  ORF Transcript_18201/g.31006 Transcript_18201/m.31006 type:complete len:213 (-) Transcript_18201:413-1051(-)
MRLSCPPRPSINVNNCATVRLSVALLFSRFGQIPSNSSINTIHLEVGPFLPTNSRACSKICRRRSSVDPTPPLDLSRRPNENIRNGTNRASSLLNSRTDRVFPVPGGPCSNIPGGHCNPCTMSNKERYFVGQSTSSRNFSVESKVKRSDSGVDSNVFTLMFVSSSSKVTFESWVANKTLPLGIVLTTTALCTIRPGLLMTHPGTIGNLHLIA